MGWLPKHWRDISEVARFRPRIDDILTDQEDIKTNGGAAKLLEVIRVWAANSLIFLTWVLNESSISVQRILQEFDGATRSYNPSYDTIDVVGGGEMANAVGEEEMEMTNDGILGETVKSAAMESMKESIAQFFHTVGSTSRVPGVPPQFPGPHPKFLNRENLELLRQKDYCTTWKAEGTRYMMLITLSGCYLIDQNFEFKGVKLQFPCGNANEGATTDGKPHHLTLLDGEMVIHTDPITKKQERRYLVFDMIAINGKSLVHEPFSQNRFCHIGDNKWTSVEQPFYKSILDITFYNGQVYTFDSNFKIQACNVNGKHPTMLVDVATLSEDEYDPHDGGSRSFYIAGLDDGERKQLLVIIRFFKRNKTKSFEVYKTKSFEVLAYDLEGGNWSKVKDFGKKTLFVGCNSSFWIEDTTGVIKGNCIYYRDDGYAEYFDSEEGREIYMGIYHMSDGTNEPHFTGESRIHFAPPIYMASIHVNFIYDVICYVCYEAVLKGVNHI